MKNKWDKQYALIINGNFLGSNYKYPTLGTYCKQFNVIVEEVTLESLLKEKECLDL